MITVDERDDIIKTFVFEFGWHIPRDLEENNLASSKEEWLFFWEHGVKSVSHPEQDRILTSDDRNKLKQSAWTLRESGSRVLVTQCFESADTEFLWSGHATLVTSVLTFRCSEHRSVSYLVHHVRLHFAIVLDPVKLQASCKNQLQNIKSCVLLMGVTVAKRGSA